MRLPRVRFTVRRLMVVVAVMGITLGAGTECMRRRGRFLALAEAHLAEARDERIDLPSLRTSMGPYDRRLAWEDYHGALALKYARAARYPWLPVEPDPPIPE